VINSTIMSDQTPENAKDLVELLEKANLLSYKDSLLEQGDLESLESLYLPIINVQ